jgi:hypothetical protein
MAEALRGVVAAMPESVQHKLVEEAQAREQAPPEEQERGLLDRLPLPDPRLDVAGSTRRTGLLDRIADFMGGS